MTTMTVTTLLVEPPSCDLPDVYVLEGGEDSPAITAKLREIHATDDETCRYEGDGGLAEHLTDEHAFVLAFGEHVVRVPRP